MTAGEIQARGQKAYPNWLPQDVRHYLVHTEDGTSIRALARASGCHASTILRQVRRNETRRDDPLVDTALDRLASAARTQKPQENRDASNMLVEKCADHLPETQVIEAEARRILRRLSEPGAVLAIAPQMEKAVVVRELSDGRTIRTAVLERNVAEAFVVKDWIESKGNRKVARYGISSAGRAALRRLLAESDEHRMGFSEAQTPFGEQHRDWAERELAPEEDGRKKRIRYNVLESPLQAISRRKGKDGQPFLTTDLVAAGERLREDFELSQLGPKVAQNWDRFLTGGERGSFAGTGGGSGAERARDRVHAALHDLGPGLGDVALRVCCFLEGMEQAEKRMGWAARSGKIVLRIALQRLVRHYERYGEEAKLIG